MGGSTAPGEYSMAMFELSASMQWTRLEQTLQIEHFAPLAIPIPDELVQVVTLRETQISDLQALFACFVLRQITQ